MPAFKKVQPIAAKKVSKAAVKPKKEKKVPKEPKEKKVAQKRAKTPEKTVEKRAYNDVSTRPKIFGMPDPRSQVRSARIDNSISLQALSEKTGINVSTLNLFERGVKNRGISECNAWLIAKALGKKLEATPLQFVLSVIAEKSENESFRRFIAKVYKMQDVKEKE